MAEALGHTTIAEGIEHASQDRVLRQLGCHLGQGYLLGRPLNAPSTESLLRSPPSALSGAFYKRPRLEPEKVATWE